MRQLPLSKHFTRPRRGRIRFVVAHHSTIIGRGDGAANDTMRRVWGTREASAHYGVDGKHEAQFVRDSDAAWATGNTTGNHEGISIEHHNSTAGPAWRVSETTWKTGARRAAKLHRKHKLGRPVSRNRGRDGSLRKHSSFTATACPGPFMDAIWDRYVAEAQRAYDRRGLPARPSAPSLRRSTPYVVTARALNVRTGPSTGHRIVKTVLAGHRIGIVGRRGDWLKTSRGRWVHSAHVRKA